VATSAGVFYSLYYEFAIIRTGIAEFRQTRDSQIAVGDLYNISIAAGYITTGFKVQQNKIDAARHWLVGDPRRIRIGSCKLS